MFTIGGLSFGESNNSMKVLMEIFDSTGREISRSVYKKRNLTEVLKNSFSRGEITKKKALTSKELKLAIDTRKLKPIMFGGKQFFDKSEVADLLK